MKSKIFLWLAVILALGFFTASYVYFSHSAGALPKFFPGFEAGASNIHFKHGLAALIAGLACLIYAWFQSGPKKTV